MKIIIATLSATAALSLVLAPSAAATTPTPEQICHELDVNPTEETVIGILEREYTGVKTQDKALAEAFSKSFFVCPRNAELIITTLNDMREQQSAARTPLRRDRLVRV